MADNKIFVELQLKYSQFLSGMKQAMSGLGSGFVSGFKGANDKFTKFTEGISKTFSTGRMLVTGGLAATAGMVVKKVIDAGHAIAENSKKYSMSAEEIQTYTYAAENSGTSFDAVGIAVKGMSRFLDDAKMKGGAAEQTLNRLNLTAADFAGLSPAEQFDKMAAAVAAVQDPTERAAIAMDVFGKSGTEIIPMISDLDRLKGEFASLNTMMSQEAVDAADRFHEQMINLETTLTNLVANSGIVKWLGDILEGMNGVVSMSDKLGEKTGIYGKDGSSSYGTNGKVAGFFSNLKDAYFGESEGQKLTTVDTEANKKKIADAKKKFEETSMTTPEQKAAKTLADEKAREARKQAEIDAQSADDLKAMEDKLRWQKMINEGKEREVAIEQALAEEKGKLKRDFTGPEDKAIRRLAGETYDAEQAGKKTKEEKDPVGDLQEKLRLQNMLNDGKEREVAIEEALAAAAKATGKELTSDERGTVADLAGKLFDAKNPVQKEKFEAAGSFYANSLSLQAGGAAERTAKATETVAKNTKETNQLLKTGTVFS